MSFRNRWRQAATPDTNLHETLPIPYVLPWVTGRFYGCSTVAGTTTTAGSNTIRAMPIYIPRSITIVSIGIEITVGGAAGSIQRFAIYTDSPDRGLPDRLVVDSGTVVADATGYQSATINAAVAAGWHWLAHAPQAGTFRMHGSGHWRAQYDAWGSQVNLSPDFITVNDVNYTSWIAVHGWPAVWLGDGAGGTTFGFIQNAATPRVLLGV